MLIYNNSFQYMHRTMIRGCSAILVMMGLDACNSDNLSDALDRCSTLTNPPLGSAVASTEGFKTTYAKRGSHAYMENNLHLLLPRFDALVRERE